MKRRILVINTGSSSIKFRVYQLENNTLIDQQRGQIEKIGLQPTFISSNGDGKETIKLDSHYDHHASLRFLLDHLSQHFSDDQNLSIGHRVVHGGNKFTAPLLINPDNLVELKQLEPLAPYHQPYNIAGIESVMAIDENIKQVACFDTAFHAQHKKPVNQFALPEEYYTEGIRRYGFHGLSYEYIALQLNESFSCESDEKILVAHLGNGSSLCAMINGQSIDSSMGFSPIEGLMMGTRCGAIDAGVLLYLLQQKSLSSEQLAKLLYCESGLLGVSGISNNMQQLLDSPDRSAAEAINLYIYRFVKEAGSMVNMLKGLDRLVFSGGIGENCAEIRKRICTELAWLGIAVSDRSNNQHHHTISRNDSQVEVNVIPTDEEFIIATHLLKLLH